MLLRPTANRTVVCLVLQFPLASPLSYETPLFWSLRPTALHTTSPTSQQQISIAFLRIDFVKPAVSVFLSPYDHPESAVASPPVECPISGR